MKFKDGVVLSDTDNGTVLIATGEAGRAFNGLIKLNKTAAFIAHMIDDGAGKEGIIEALLEKYEITPEHAAESVDKVVAQLGSVGIIEG